MRPPLHARLSSVVIINSFCERSLCLFVAGASFTVIILFYIRFPQHSRSALLVPTKRSQDRGSNDKAYTVNTRGCRIPKLDLWHPRLKDLIQRLPDLNCSVTPALVNVVRLTDRVTFRINRSVLRDSYGGSVRCSVMPLYWENDEEYSLGPSQYFTNELHLNVTYEFVKIKCRNILEQTVYVDFQPFIKRKSTVDERIRQVSERRTRNIATKFSIILLGIDSASKNQFLRHMSKTDQFIRENLTFIEMHGYNKLGKNTYPNIVPFLTGKLETEVPDTTKHSADELPLIWKEFQENGYRTLFAEDEPDLSIFNLDRVGFKSEPTDYYLRPFSVAMEPYVKLKLNWPKGCVNHRSETSLILRWTEELFDVFRSQPLFAFTFLTRLSHDGINQLSYLDKPVLDFLNRFSQNGHLNNTIVIFFSDHGFRYGEIRRTYTGRMEGKLPFMFIILPSWFPAKYPQLYENLILNQRRLTTPLDMYATLKDLLHFNGKSYKQDSLERGISLLRYQVSENRTCNIANIKNQWCACLREENVSIDDPHVIKSADAIINKINSVTSEKRSLCAELSLTNVLNASRYPVELGEDHPFDGATVYSVQLRALPSNGTFDGTVMYNGKSRYSVDVIERTDRYGAQSACIHDVLLKSYCYCKHWKKEIFVEDVGV